ncbi:MAG: tripartite tricarboxylate transporter permease [Deltaproteobacteria bacterium]|nr:MAG: tripartite tricarboxylate transporter permease [Deltaproteobacteria bacterium]
MLTGFSVALSPGILLACLVGVLLGTIVGVLPGLGPTATMSLMLPFTLRYGPETGLIMMAGIWYGAQYGGSTTSILVNIPGEASSVITCMDGYQMGKKGRAGAALALVAVGSFIAGTLGNIGLQMFAPPLAQAALAFGPAEYLALMILAFVVLSTLTSESPLKGYLMIALGLWIGMIGIDPIDGVPRFTFGSYGLMSGLDFLPIAMGLFGVTEILSIAVETYVPRIVDKIRLRDLYPNREEVQRSVKPVLRGSVLGFFVGLLPGPAPTISTFFSYALEKRFSKQPENFGKGMVEGVVGPEAANNSAVTGAMIPLLALGIPFAPPAAVLLAGLRMHHITPGPFLFQNAPQIFWGFIAAMYIGNVMLLILNLPLVGLFARIATVRTQLLMPIVSIICLAGVYSIRNSLFDIWVMIVTGVLGFFMRKWKFPVAPLVIGIVLGPMTENSFRQTCMMCLGNFYQLCSRPIAMGLFVLTIVFLVFNIHQGKKLKKVRGEGEI